MAASSEQGRANRLRDPGGRRAACVCGPSSSRLPWKVRGTLPGTPPSRREAPCPDARTLPGASGAFPSRERHSFLTRSDGGDSYAGGGEGGQDAGVGGLVGDELADGGDLADLGEGYEADLGAVGDDDDRAGALDQRAVRVGLDLVVGGEAGFEGDAVRADKHDVEVQAGQAGLGDGADQLIGLGPGDAAGYDELEVGADGHLGGDVQGVGDEGEALVVDQGPRDLGGGGAPGEAD